MTLNASNANLITHAHIALPCDTYPLVVELVQRLGGEIIPSNEENIVRPPMSERERAGRMLKGLRLRADMTQKALAKAISVPQGHISEYEANKRPIPSSKVSLLASVLNTVESHFTVR